MVDFYDPNTGVFNPPSSSVSWLKLSADGHFELAGFNADLVPGSGCKKSAMVYARGQFKFTKPYYSDNIVFQPEVNTLIETLSNCATNDGSQQRSLPLEQQFFYLHLGITVNNQEVLEMRCSSTAEERSEWQFLICPSSGSDFRALYSRR